MKHLHSGGRSTDHASQMWTLVIGVDGVTAAATLIEEYLTVEVGPSANLAPA
jgi:hypothetical protein